MAKQKKANVTVEQRRLEGEPYHQPDAPAEPDALAEYVRDNMGVQIGASAVVQGNDGPLAYLVHSFFEGRFVVAPDGTWTDLDATGGPRPPADCVVWANRGGGKTYLGAVATALDMIFKPGIEIRILGGSAEQGKRMHEHLRKIFERDELEPHLDGPTTESRVRLKNRSRVEILSHSERSVRGVRVQKLRCDEVDLFDPALWQAAQLVTRSTSPIRGPWGNEVRGAIEVLSTMHVPMGLMWKLTRETGRVTEWHRTSPGREPGEGSSQTPTSAQDHRGEQAPPAHRPCASAQGSSRVLFKWGVIDALEKCGPEHTCDTCTLKEECRGLAKTRKGSGHITVRDARVLKQRTSRTTWDTEMLCKEPSREGCVYPDFSRARHVAHRDASAKDLSEANHTIIAGMDFGVRSPSVVIWGYVEDDGKTLVVIDEYAEVGRTLGDHVAAIKARQWGTPQWVGIDPAGAARNEQTGTSNLRAMRHMHIDARARRAGVALGIESIRVRLSPQEGPPLLRIMPRCTGLIDALSRYHYPSDKPGELIPEKDGSDHWCDALRYLVVNLEGKGVAVGHT